MYEFLVRHSLVIRQGRAVAEQLKDTHEVLGNYPKCVQERGKGNLQIDLVRMEIRGNLQ